MRILEHYFNQGGSVANLKAANHLFNKTDSLIEKYGPGPVVHYHIGVFDDCERDTVDVDRETIQRRISRAQEALLLVAAREWEAKACLGGDIVDVGCGLGGGSIRWAQECATSVTAVTNVEAHIPLIAEFADRAGVGHQVSPLLSGAEDLPPGLRFDGAVAMESLCYMNRADVFERLGKVLVDGAAFCVQDVFLERPQFREAFDDYWRTRIGTLDEYIEAARRAGFVLVGEKDITADTSEFWIQSGAWNDLRLAEVDDAVEYQRLMESARWHANFYRAWRDEAISVRLLKFEKVATAA
ncbi:cyclopropane-fatty-acyl-phospholipid synthase family protein [Amycolatopsis sp. cg5]|uniref:SAM-dependent methyltransferase n=1 Tax=Amycolatopsis sp. cg5 TaxID=3238802 RepID=UPI0035235216